MKNYEFIDYVLKDGEWVNLYVSLDTGVCYTFTDEEVEQMQKAEENRARRKMLREQQKIVKARRAKIFKTVGGIALVGILVTSLYCAIPHGIKGDTPQEIPTYVEQESTYNYKSKLVDLLNASNDQYENQDYRNLFYLYYNAYLCGYEDGNLINSLIDYKKEDSLLTRDDFDDWYESDNVDFKKLMVYPENTANLINYDNIDIFLNFNACLKKEIKAGRLTVEEYLAFMTPFLKTLEQVDPDLKRVWDYQSDNNSNTLCLIDVKLLCYEDTLNKKSIEKTNN